MMMLSMFFMDKDTLQIPNLMSVRIKTALVATGHTQRDAARLLGIAESSFSNKLSGKARFSAEEIVSLAYWLNVSSDSLLGRTPLEVA